MGTRFQEAGHDAIAFGLAARILSKLEEFIGIYSLAQRQGLVFNKGKELFGLDLYLNFTPSSTKLTELEFYKLKKQLEELTKDFSFKEKEHNINFLAFADQEEKINEFYGMMNNFVKRKLEIYSRKIASNVENLLNSQMIKGNKSNLEKEVKLPDFTIFTSKAIYVIEAKFEMLPRFASTTKEILTFNEFAKQNFGKFYLVTPHPNLKEKYSHLSIPTALRKKEKEHLNYLKNQGCEIFFFDITKAPTLKTPEIKFLKYEEVIK